MVYGSQFAVRRAFSRVDTTGDKKIDLPEFIQCLPDLQRWGVHLSEAEAPDVFNKIDDNVRMSSRPSMRSSLPCLLPCQRLDSSAR